MPRLTRGLLTLAALASLAAIALGGSACGTSTTPTLPTTPTVPAVTDTFPGTLNQNGAMTFPFVASAAGAITVTLKSVGPNSALAIGLSLGTWNATAGFCTVGAGLANDNALQGAVLIGSVGAAVNLCVRVYDPGTLADPTQFPITFQVQVVHP